MENKITPELLEKARQAKSAEDLYALAKENGIELTKESAQAYFEQLNRTGELADEELDNVSGGCSRLNGHRFCPRCKVELVLTHEKSGLGFMKFYYVCTKCGYSQKIV